MNQTPVSLNFSAHGTASGTPWKAVAGRSRVAVICASWHTDVVHQARDSMAAELQAQGVAAQNISHFNVPGAFEIPLLAKKLADSGRFDAVIACALVVNGGIYRHEFVSSAVIEGLMRVQLDTEVPVFSAVLARFPRTWRPCGVLPCPLREEGRGSGACLPGGAGPAGAGTGTGPGARGVSRPASQHSFGWGWILVNTELGPSVAVPSRGVTRHCQAAMTGIT